jgi:NuA3 HAT complex component NTO1
MELIYASPSVRWDRHDYFKNPVSKQEVPDYFDVIKKPMCWEVIDTRLDRHQYWEIQDYFVWFYIFETLSY